MTKSIVAFIPARANSKGLPQKNKAQLCGKPLVQWTIEAAQDSTCITDICLTSDDEDILSLARASNVHVLRRPRNLSGDDVDMYPVIEHAAKWYRNMVTNFEYGILLQPTSPLRTAAHIDSCFQAMIAKKANAAISVRLFEKKALQAFIVSNGYLTPILNKNTPFERRQQLPDCYVANGAIYIFLMHEFEQEKSFLLSKTHPFLMDARDSIDIDSAEDFKEAEERIWEIGIGNNLL